MGDRKAKASRRAAANDDKDDKEARKQSCLGCLQHHPERDLELTCDRGHLMAGACLQNFLTTSLSRKNWATSMPLRCPLCSSGHAPYYPGAITALLTDAQAALYSQADVQLSVLDDEVLVECPFCPYAEIYAKDSVAVLFHCHRTHCKKHSCTVCFQEFAPTCETAAMHHLRVCDVFKEIYHDLLDAVRKGTTNGCPECGCAGQKDDNCTHMTCGRCRTYWCYSCGLSSTQCNLTRGSVWPIGHSKNWRTNPQRCPIYLREFSEVNASWGDTPEAELAFYHRYKTMRLLSSAVAKWGRPKIIELLQHFPGALGGYSIDEICAWSEDALMSNRGIGLVMPMTKKRKASEAAASSGSRRHRS